MKPHVRVHAIAFAIAVLAGCAVGPNFKPPPAPQTTGFITALGLPPSTSSAPVAGGEAQHYVEGLDIPGQWWSLLNSPAINSLIEQALKNNPSLDAAQATLREANENLAAERGNYYPQVSGSYEAQRQKSSGASFGQPAFGTSIYSLNSATLNVSYTLDAFGGVRRQVEQLQATVDHQRFTLEATYLSLTANIVTAAVTEASLRAQIAASEEIARSEQVQVDITQRRVAAGGASRADVLQELTNLQTTLATLPSLRSQLAQERTLLATYVGALPADYTGAAIDLDSLTLPANLPVSLPSKVVEQRPDVREYSALLHEATAQIGIATANMLPQFSITGSYGSDAVKFSDLLSPASIVYSLAGTVTQSIFKGGALLHQRRSAVAAAQVAAANYKSTVITAFQNVSNSLFALQFDADALVAQTTAEKTAAESLKIVRAQYKSGASTYLQVLTSEQNYQTAVLNLVKARAQRLTDSAALFQSSGGGWWNREDVANSTSKD